MGARNARGFPQLATGSARLLALVVLLIFFCDAINADVLVAAVVGDVAFSDNALILDSQFDTTSVVPDAGHSIDYFLLCKAGPSSSKVSTYGTPLFDGTRIVEDIDSPTVLDGATTASLQYSYYQYFSRSKERLHTARTTLDRPVTFACLLI